MFAIPVPTTRRSVAARNAPAWVSVSLPYASPYQSEPYPSASMSLATCWASPIAHESLVHQTPTRDGKSVRAMIATLDQALSGRVLLGHPAQAEQEGAPEDDARDDALHRSSPVLLDDDRADLLVRETLHRRGVALEQAGDLAVIQALERGQDVDDGAPTGVLRAHVPAAPGRQLVEDLLGTH